MPEKEIWKLLELLNEYHHFNSDLIGYFYDEEYEKFYLRTELPLEDKHKLEKVGALIDDGINEVRVENEWICSKRFGFIQRLVEQDKIDIHKIPIIQWELNTHSYEENLLMCLAISEQPIELLISYLK